VRAVLELFSLLFVFVAGFVCGVRLAHRFYVEHAIECRNYGWWENGDKEVSL
jgi:hypothetical protein